MCVCVFEVFIVHAVSVSGHMCMSISKPSEMVGRGEGAWMAKGHRIITGQSFSPYSVTTIAIFLVRCEKRITYAACDPRWTLRFEILLGKNKLFIYLLVNVQNNKTIIIKLPMNYLTCE